MNKSTKMQKNPPEAQNAAGGEKTNQNFSPTKAAIFKSTLLMIS